MNIGEICRLRGEVRALEHRFERELRAARERRDNVEAVTDLIIDEIFAYVFGKVFKSRVFVSTWTIMERMWHGPGRRGR